ncbi:hypothetical protein [Pedobacter sp. AJM]|uniref:hypothetical protein n=1 Tax=Pedobacter sp. AJM TaxID=2003629 RepID=UPI000B4B2A2C|nr:hypothetical protein [Pedobacter sp. AJM]OWK71975.1 hypothetical protein CBW18_05790 [Pedobacter sp. AJM]
MEVKEIRFDDGSLVFYDETGHDIYFIREDLLDEVMDDGDSEWINQLSSKSWATKAILQQVADIITEKFPDNKINWGTTNKLIQTQE